MTVHHMLEMELKKRFHYSSFRTGQKEIIQDILNGEDVLGILPTGSGKSICYQLPAMMLEGITIVVSPLISLMIDQVKELRAKHIKQVTALNSFQDLDERRKVLSNIRAYKIIYISPELLQQPFILKKLEQLNISLFVIDEAHCISQWGYEFRPDYLKLGQAIDRLQAKVTLALSATCPPHVQDDILRALNKPKMVKHIYPMDRTNIAFSVQHVKKDKEKLQTITKLLTDIKVPTLIYFNNRMTAEEIVSRLSKQLPERKIAFYHGGMEQMDRIIIQQQFMNNQLDVICCTNAFGMGINKSDIHLVIHYHFPLQLESYIQEAGRAGRNGEQSVSHVFYSPEDIIIPNSLIENELPNDGHLRQAFQYLLTIALTDRELDFDRLKMEQAAQMNETQWHFLHYQLEKLDIVKGKEVIYDEYNWKQAFSMIQRRRDERLQYKQNKLSEMITWLNETECLRKHLYKGFQDEYTVPDGPCCSNCGFTFEQWNPGDILHSNKAIHSWQERLKEVLLIGEKS